jgi:hypothetical protein
VNMLAVQLSSSDSNSSSSLQFNISGVPQHFDFDNTPLASPQLHYWLALAIIALPRRTAPTYPINHQPAPHPQPARSNLRVAALRRGHLRALAPGHQLGACVAHLGPTPATASAAKHEL